MAGEPEISKTGIKKMKFVGGSSKSFKRFAINWILE